MIRGKQYSGQELEIKYILAGVLSSLFLHVHTTFVPPMIFYFITPVQPFATLSATIVRASGPLATAHRRVPTVGFTGDPHQSGIENSRNPP